jgi:hypothetical protein
MDCFFILVSETEDIRHNLSAGRSLCVRESLGCVDENCRVEIASVKRRVEIAGVNRRSANDPGIEALRQLLRIERAFLIVLFVMHRVSLLVIPRGSKERQGAAARLPQLLYHSLPRKAREQRN